MKKGLVAAAVLVVVACVGISLTEVKVQQQKVVQDIPAAPVLEQAK